MAINVIAIRSAVEKNSIISISPLCMQFHHLIAPLSSFNDSSRTIVVVFDALDECGTVEDRESLLTIFADGFVHLLFTVRTIITSRARSAPCHLDITSSLRNWTSRPLLISMISRILSFFSYRMSYIRDKGGICGLAWIGLVSRYSAHLANKWALCLGIYSLQIYRWA
jgi:hypothetical protein